MFNFPWTNFHELNLDWILSVVKEAKEVFDNGRSDIDYAVDTADEAKEIATQAAEATIADNSISTSKLQNGAVTNAKLANNSVTTSNIVDRTIIGNDIAENTIESYNIKNGTIIGADIAENTITYDNLASGAVVTSKLSDNAVSTPKIADGAVTLNKLDASLQNKVADNWGSTPLLSYTFPANTSSEETITVPDITQYKEFLITLQRSSNGRTMGSTFVPAVQITSGAAYVTGVFGLPNTHVLSDFKTAVVIWNNSTSLTVAANLTETAEAITIRVWGK